MRVGLLAGTRRLLLFSPFMATRSLCTSDPLRRSSSSTRYRERRAESPSWSCTKNEQHSFWQRQRAKGSSIHDVNRTSAAASRLGGRVSSKASVVAISHGRELSCFTSCSCCCLKSKLFPVRTAAMMPDVCSSVLHVSETEAIESNSWYVCT